MLMKKIFVFLSLISSSSLSYAQSFSADAILGYWLSESGKGVIQIYKKGNEFEGKLVWIKDIHDGKVKDKFDIENPDEKLKTRSLVGLVNLHGFKFDKDDQEWTDGKIYDPNNGKTYSSYMSLKSKNELKLRGYIGIALIGRTSKWIRQKSTTPDKYSK